MFMCQCFKANKYFAIWKDGSKLLDSRQLWILTDSDCLKVFKKFIPILIIYKFPGLDKQIKWCNHCSHKKKLSGIPNSFAMYYSSHINDPVDFEYQINDDNEAEHVLEFVMTSKTAEFTQIDELGNIVNDALLSVKTIEFDGIDIFQTFSDLSVYSHNFNGTQPETQEKFYGNIGCNGRVAFKFTTPFYLWLLENM